MSRNFVLIVGTLFMASVAMAQPYTSALGRFQVDQVKGCAPLTVTLTNLLAGNCTAGNPCSMDYLGNGQQTLNLFTFQYTTPGVYKLRVLYQGQGDDEITITVVPNIQPNFEIYSCANSDVTIKVLEKSYQQLLIDFTNDGTTDATIPSGNNAIAYHDYATPGSKTIAVRGLNINSADNCDSKVQTFNALAALPPPAINKLTVLDKASIQLDFTAQPNIQYRLEVAVNSSGPFQQLATLYDPTTYKVTNLKTEENFYCFRLSAFDACLGSIAASSTTICSQRLNLNIQSGVNNLNWITTNTGIQNFTIERNGTFYTSIGPSQSGFPDSNIDCKVNYCYRLITRYPGGATSTTLEQCGVSFKTDNPPAITNASTVVTSQGLEIKWIQDPSSNPPGYEILIAIDDQNYGALGTSSSTQFLHKDYLTESNFTYRVNYTDECDNKSGEGIVIDPIRLTGSMDNNVISLSWTEYEGWINGVNEYVIDKLNLNGSLIQSIGMGTSTSFVDDDPDPVNQFVTYKVRAIPVEGAVSVSISNPLVFIKDSKIFFPTAFSPNGDQLNDEFFVSGQYIVKMELSIFNRWGELIFTTTKKDEPWNGTINGKPAAEDAYVWTAQVTDRAGRTFKESGTVALLRRKK